MSADLEKKQLTVQLSGGYRFISALKKEDIRLFVDAAGLEAGEHMLPVQIDIDNAPEFSCALSAPEITLTLQAKPSAHSVWTDHIPAADRDRNFPIIAGGT